MRESENPRFRISLSHERHRRLRSALIREQDPREYGAFLFGEPRGEDLLEVVDMELLRADQLDSQTSGYLELRDEVLQEMILRAHRSSRALIEAHSHPFSTGLTVSFSPFDEAGLSEVAPHVVWRLPGRPYAALVFGHRSFDGLFWSASRPAPSGAVDLVVGDEVLIGSGESLSRWGKCR